MYEPYDLLFLLFAGFALGDFALQGDAMAKGKNRNRKPDYIPEGQKYMPCWYFWLGAHGFIHGGIVYLITGSLFLGVFETIMHFVIDFMKCENWTNPYQDQLLHFVCRMMYWIYMIV